MKYFFVAFFTWTFVMEGIGQVNKSDYTRLKIDTFRIGKILFRPMSISQAEFEKYPIIDCDTPRYIYSKQEKNNLIRDAAFVKRKGDSLVFKLSSGSSVSLVNRMQQNDGFMEYRYVRKLNDIGQYFVKATGWESHTNFLVSEKTGKTTPICGTPVLSPDRKFMMAGVTDIGGIIDGNGFDLFSVEGNSVNLIGAAEIYGSYESPIAKWGPSIIKWIKPKELLVEIRVLENDKESVKYIKLIME